jgi:hypothetical protein
LDDPEQAEVLSLVTKHSNDCALPWRREHAVLPLT